MALNYNTESHRNFGTKNTLSIMRKIWYVEQEIKYKRRDN